VFIPQATFTPPRNILQERAVILPALAPPQKNSTSRQKTRQPCGRGVASRESDTENEKLFFAIVNYLCIFAFDLKNI